MAKVEISAHEVLYNGSKIPFYARIYADRTFINDDNQSVLAGQPGSKNFVKEVDVDFADGVVTIPSLTGDNRLDSTIVEATGHVLSTYTVTLHSSSGALLTIVESLQNIKIPSSPTTTTWDTLAELAVTVTIPYRAEYYNREQIDRLLSDLSVASLASDVLAGKVSLDTLPDSLPSPIAVGVNSPRIAKNLSKDYSNSLSSAATAIGATATVLEVTRAVTVSANLDLSSTGTGIILDVKGTGLITVASGVRLTVNRMINPGNRQIFALADATAEVFFSNGAVSEMNTAWIAGTGNGVNVTNAINNYIASATLQGGICVIRIPNLTILYDGDGDALPSGVRIVGNGYYSSGSNGYGTTIRASGDCDYLFKIEEATFGGSFENIILDADSHTVETLVLFEGTGGAGTTSGQFTFNRVMFDGGNYNVKHNSLGASWQLAQIGFYDCKFYALTAAFRPNAVNGQYTFVNPYFALPENGQAFEIAGSGLLTIIGGEGAGTFHFKQFTSANVNTATDRINITAHGFNDEDEVVIYTSGTRPAATPALERKLYILYRDADNVSLSATPGGAEIDLTTGGTGTHTLVRLSAKVMTITGSHGGITFDGFQDEGCLTFVQNDASDISGIINITGGSLIQSKIQMNESCQINITKSNIMAHAVQGQPGGGYVTIDKCNLRDLSVDDGTTAATDVIDLTAPHGAIVTTENIAVTGQFIQRIPQSYVSPLSQQAETAPLLDIGNIHDGAISYNRVLLRLGRRNSDGTWGLLRYDIGRSDDDGFLEFFGIQGGGFSGFRFDAPVQGVINAYNATNWNGSTNFVTEDAARDEIEALRAAKASLSGATFSGGITGTTAGFSGAVTGASIAIGSGTAITKIVKGAVTINPASINATTFSSQTFALTGASVGDSLILNPPAAGLTSGLMVCQAFVSSADTITISFYNSSGAPIDESSASWNYVLIRS